MSFFGKEVIQKHFCFHLENGLKPCFVPHVYMRHFGFICASYFNFRKHFLLFIVGQKLVHRKGEVVGIIHIQLIPNLTKVKIVPKHLLFELLTIFSSTFSLSSGRCWLTGCCCRMLIWSCLMREVNCVHCMGVSSHSSNTLDCQRTVNALCRGGGKELWIRVMLVTEQVGTTYTHISAICNGQLKLYLLCLSTLNRTL